MSLLEKPLQLLARMQHRFGIVLVIIFTLFTIIMGVGATKIYFEGDIDKMMPQHLPIYQFNDKVTEKFSGQDVMFILLMLDESLEIKDTPQDIRNPDIMRYIVDLETELLKESKIDSVISLSPLIKSLEQYDMLTKENIVHAIANDERISGLVSRDYKKTILIIYSDVGKTEENVVAMTKLIQSKIDALSVPAGVEARITGTPSIIATIIQLLKHDSVYTLALASLIIIILLIFLQKSIIKAILIYIPILLGIIWTIGTMGWAGIPIGLATAGLGAMILGLGVEYGVFVLTRYLEERSKGNSEEKSLLVSVPAVGQAIVGSGMTTIIGFIALTLSIMPMMQYLGLSLAIGIFYCIIAAVVVEPILIHYYEKYKKKRECK
jgi:uncharacterized protein